MNRRRGGEDFLKKALLPLSFSRTALRYDSLPHPLISKTFIKRGILKVKINTLSSLFIKVFGKRGEGVNRITQ